MLLTYKEIATFTAGSHISRIQQSADGPAFRFYATEQFLVDDWLSAFVSAEKEQWVKTHQDVVLTQKGDVVISLIHGKAARVSIDNAGRILGNNYVKVDVDASQIDTAWFLWHFNESPEGRRQRIQATQGSTVVQRIAVNKLKNFTVTLPSLAQQKAMGGLYLAAREKCFYQQRIAALSEQQILSLLSGMI
ncbi:restriction endonuclease subunit S [Cronobacter universalis]|nr:restriction endonuclease subunit S [Cronobacter universalis]